MPLYATACPRNCYSTCSMMVRVENGKICGIEPHKGNKATPDGVCLKGLSYLERIYSSDRLLAPLKKDPSSNTFTKIPWKDAIDLIMKKIMAVKKEFGPQSVFYYEGSGTKGLLTGLGLKFWRRFGGVTTTYGDLCWPAGLEATRLTLGEIKHNAPWDLKNAKLILVWGKNPAETNLHQMTFLNQALDHGAKLAVIDPRRTMTSQKADILIQPRPGTDGALALAMAHVLIKRNLIDRKFIDKHVLGFAEFEASIKDFTPEKAAAITDVSPEFIERLALLFGRIKPATICAGYGMQRYSNSGQTMRAIMALPAITGNIGKPGAGWVYANLQGSIFSKDKPPVSDYPPKPGDDPMRVSISAARFGPDLLDTKDPPIRVAWIERGNPVSQNPETHTVLKALRAIDFKVVVDQFMTDTALEADLVLPAKSLFEQTDIIGSYWHPYIQVKQKIMDPPGEVKPESEIYHMLSQKMGYSQEMIPGPSDQSVDAYLEKRLEPFPGLSLDLLRQNPVLAPGSETIAFSDLKFNTPSNKIELYSDSARSLWKADPLPSYLEPVESPRNTPGKFPLNLLTPNTKNRIHSQFNNLQLIRMFSDTPLVVMNPDDAVKRGVSSGQRVRVFNDRGEIHITARLDYSLKSGCVSITNGWRLQDEAAVNLCSCARETDMGFGAAFHDNMVEVEVI